MEYNNVMHLEMNFSVLRKLSASTELLSNAGCHKTINSIPHPLRWLCIEFQVEFKILVLIPKLLYDLIPVHLRLLKVPGWSLQ